MFRSGSEVMKSWLLGEYMNDLTDAEMAPAPPEKVEVRPLRGSPAPRLRIAAQTA